MAINQLVNFTPSFRSYLSQLELVVNRAWENVCEEIGKFIPFKNISPHTERIHLICLIIDKDKIPFANGALTNSHCKCGKHPVTVMGVAEHSGKSQKIILE